MKKLSIVHSQAEKRGKSSSIQEVFKKLNQEYLTSILKDKTDIKATIEIDNILIGLESQGDPSSRMP